MSSLKALVLIFLFVLSPLAFAKEATSMAIDPEMEKTVKI
jgi:hypothetical protein